MKTKDFNGIFNLIGANIKKYRIEKQLSQRDLSDKLALLGINLYHSDISKIENGTLFVRDFEIVAICLTLNITLEQIFENTFTKLEFNNF